MRVIGKWWDERPSAREAGNTGQPGRQPSPPASPPSPLPVQLIRSMSCTEITEATFGRPLSEQQFEDLAVSWIKKQLEMPGPAV